MLQLQRQSQDLNAEYEEAQRTQIAEKMETLAAKYQWLAATFGTDDGKVGSKGNDKEETETDDKGNKGDKDKAMEKSWGRSKRKSEKDRTRVVDKVAKAQKEAEVRKQKVRDSSMAIEGLLNNLRSSIGDHAFHLTGLQRVVKHQHEVYPETWAHQGQQIHKSFAGFVDVSRT